MNKKDIKYQFHRIKRVLRADQGEASILNAFWQFEEALYAEVRQGSRDAASAVRVFRASATRANRKLSAGNRISRPSLRRFLRELEDIGERMVYAMQAGHLDESDAEEFQESFFDIMEPILGRGIPTRFYLKEEGKFRPNRFAGLRRPCGHFPGGLEF